MISSFRLNTICVIQYNISDVSEPLESVLQSVRALGEARGFYWAVARAVPTLGAARVLRDLCGAPALLRAADAPHLQGAVSLLLYLFICKILRRIWESYQ